MKYEGIVIKLTKNKAIVTNDEFQCFYIKRSSIIYVGKHVEFTNSDIIKKRSIQTKLMFSAACILFAITCSLYFTGRVNIMEMFSESKVFAYVDVDINPSLEMEIDDNGKVLRLVPLNDDAKAFAEKTGINKVEVSKAINKIADEVKGTDSISETAKEYILVSSTLNTKRNEEGKEYQAKKDKLDNIMNSLKKNILENGKVNVYIMQTNISEREDAHNEGISSGRYKLYNEIKKQRSDFSINEAKSVNVNELVKVISDKNPQDSIDNKPEPTASPLKVEDTFATPSATLKVEEATDVTPTQIPTLAQTPTPTQIPTPMPKSTQTPLATPIPTQTPWTIQTAWPIQTPMQIPWPTQMPWPTQIPWPTPTPNPNIEIIPTFNPTSTTRKTNSVYMKFEAYNYPGQFIQHKIHYEAYISANGILPDDHIFKIVPGLADPNCISFESKNFPGFFLKNENFKIVLKPYDGSQDFAENVTFRKVPGLADENLTSFQAYKYPNRYIRHYNFILQIEEIGSDSDKKDATYKGIEVE